MSRTAVSLDPVRTIGNRVVNARYAEVDRRIRAGVANAVVGRVDFERVRPITVTQMLRRVQGIRLEDSSGTTIITSGRGDRITPGGSRLPCILRVMVDGVLSTASQVERLVPTDIHAIEVFLGPARIPLELGPVRAGGVGCWPSGREWIEEPHQTSALSITQPLSRNTLCQGFAHVRLETRLLRFIEPWHPIGWLMALSMALRASAWLPAAS